MKEELKKELEELSPFLLEMKEKPEGFTVPNHFFNNMRLDIMNKVKAEMPAVVAEPVQKDSFFSKIKQLFQPRFAVGFASLVVLLGVGIYFYQNNDNNVLVNNDCNTMACLTDDEINNYIEENIDEFDEKTIEEVSFDDENADFKVPSDIDEELNHVLDDMLKKGELNEKELDEIL